MTIALILSQILDKRIKILESKFYALGNKLTEKEKREHLKAQKKAISKEKTNKRKKDSESTLDPNLLSSDEETEKSVRKQKKNKKSK